MAFLKNVAVRSNDTDFLLPLDEPDSNSYTLWKDKNYSTTLLNALKQFQTGYRHAYSGHNMYKFFKILKVHGLLGSVAMSKPPATKAIEVEGQFVIVAGKKIYIDAEGFEL